MSFTSVTFFIFLILLFPAYFLFPKKYRWTVLLAASYIFYIVSSPVTTAFLIFTTVTTFFTGILLGKANQEYAEKLSASGDTLTKEMKGQYRAENKKRKS